MKNFSNRYIFVFSFIMVVIVASLLALAATLLQPAQERNLEIAKKRSMLESIGVISTKDNSVELYDRYITESFVLNIQGEVIEDVDAFNVVLRNEQRKPPEDQHLPVFRAFPDDGEKVVILPVEGKGLWGPIYGYVSLRSDLNTIYGVTFERGVALTFDDRRQVLISGTASIDKSGNVLHIDDIRAQSLRMIENVEVLLAEAQATFENVAQIIVYLRRQQDYQLVQDLFASRFPAIPTVIVMGKVCRPAWLIEMECIALL